MVNEDRKLTGNMFKEDKSVSKDEKSILVVNICSDGGS